jgi:hypothetical protein
MNEKKNNTKEQEIHFAVIQYEVLTKLSHTKKKLLNRPMMVLRKNRKVKILLYEMSTEASTDMQAT